MAGFKDYGFRMTPQRMAILDFLDGNTSHPSAEEIYQAVLQRYPTISFATVYNTLEALRKNGKVWELNIDDDRKRYDPNTHLHHHLLCTKCRKIVDIHYEFDLAFPVEQNQGFKLTGCHVEFYGLCQDCAAEEA